MPSQALGRLSPSGATLRKCLHELKSICRSRETLPTSCTPPGLTTGPEPIARGDFGHAFRGTLDGSQVHIKRLYLDSGDGKNKAGQVRLRYHPSPQSSGLTSPTGILQGDRVVEAPKASEHSASAWCHSHTLPTYFVLDTWWQPA